LSNSEHAERGGQFEDQKFAIGVSGKGYLCREVQRRSGLQIEALDDVAEQ
jgi:hypothetical protein